MRDGSKLKVDATEHFFLLEIGISKVSPQIEKQTGFLNGR